MNDNITYACVLYKLDTPIVYNKGTAYEETHDTFLHCYAQSDAKAEAIANELNKTATDRRYYTSRQRALWD